MAPTLPAVKDDLFAPTIYAVALAAPFNLAKPGNWFSKNGSVGAACPARSAFAIRS
jgi:hypothetical protein